MSFCTCSYVLILSLSCRYAVLSSCVRHVLGCSYVLLNNLLLDNGIRAFVTIKVSSQDVDLPLQVSAVAPDNRVVTNASKFENFENSSPANIAINGGSVLQSLIPQILTSCDLLPRVLQARPARPSASCQTSCGRWCSATSPGRAPGTKPKCCCAGGLVQEGHWRHSHSC